MPRKGTLEDQLARIERRRGRGKRRDIHETRGEQSLDDFEREVKQEMLVYLKAQDFSHEYCANALGVARSTITAWLADENLSLRDKIIKTRKAMAAGAMRLIDSYLIEVVEGLMQIFRTTENEVVAKDIGFELLAIAGIVKVNKSESRSQQLLHTQTDIVDKSGLIEIAKNAPPEVQAKMAANVEELIALSTEHGTVELSGDAPDFIPDEGEQSGA